MVASKVALPEVDGVNVNASVSNVPLPGVVVVASVCARLEPPFAKPDVVIEAAPEPASAAAARSVKLCAPAPAEPL